MIDYPPGLLGRIAEYIHDQSCHPVREIAIAGAIGCMSGVVGRMYNVSGTGLNQYTILLAQTGTGKSAMRLGIGKLFQAVSGLCPEAKNYIGPGRMASSQSIIKYMSNRNNRSFCSLLGEFGDTLKAMATNNPNSSFYELNQFLRQSYEMSAAGMVLEPSIFADSRKNTMSVLSPSLSILGESTPETFYDSLDSHLVLSGLVSRFTVIEYKGPSPPLNRNIQPLSNELTVEFAELCKNVSIFDAADKTINVEIEKDAADILWALADKQNEMVNAATKEIHRHIWNRLHLKTLKLSALVAVGVDQKRPVIDSIASNWASNIVISDIQNMVTKFSVHTTQSSEDIQQLQKLIKVMADFTRLPWKKVKNYAKKCERLHSDRIIPYEYAQRRLATLPVFKKSKNGAANSLLYAMHTLKKNGNAHELEHEAILSEYGYSGRCFTLTTPDEND